MSGWPVRLNAGIAEPSDTGADCADIGKDRARAHTKAVRDVAQKARRPKPRRPVVLIVGSQRRSRC